MKKYLTFISILFIISSVLIACGNQKDTSNDKKKSATVTVTDARGEKVDIPANPKRIADISGSSEELIILGHKLVATANSDSYDYTKPAPYIKDELKDAKIVGYYMVDKVDVEAILQTQPDLIIVSKRHLKSVDQLKKIAPVIVLDEGLTKWKQRFKQIGTIFGQEKEVNDWLAKYDAKATEIGNDIKKKTGKGTVLTLLADEKNTYTFGNEGLGQIVNDDMKLPRPEGASKNTGTSQINLENISKLNPDVLIVVSSKGAQAELEKSSIWNGLKAVKNKNVYYFPNQPYFGQSFLPIGKDKLLDDLKEKMAK
ncbi:ABC transporter substrate-binding protein [Heyndrickxia sporothermodurans]|uniref:ABC transporter substrate-binding protein n=1 Tax=Heyndrickxia sporothermodurans TaxID=46224 RepID=UPI002DBD1E5F|nr:ABC transporter substrate-binding protein [Heyndrickxia sporothermodurans]MEB6550742.1 ABC transporter substrate-binding protein [Heyndrickxia sporothermodurans]